MSLHIHTSRPIPAAALITRTVVAVAATEAVAAGVVSVLADALQTTGNYLIAVALVATVAAMLALPVWLITRYQGTAVTVFLPDNPVREPYGADDRWAAELAAMRGELQR